MVDYAEVVTGFRVGRVLSRSFSTAFRNISSFGLLALVISSPTYVYTILKGPGELILPDNPMAFWSNLGAEPFVVFVVNFLLGYLVMAALTYGTIQDLRNDRASLGECFSRGLALMFPAVGVAIVVILVMVLVVLFTVVPGAIVIGLLAAATGSTVLSVILTPALFIPVVYVWITLWVIIPVAVIERRGLGSLARSAALTKGYRWRIFVLLLLLAVVGIGVGLLMAALGGAAATMETAGSGGASSTVFTGQIAIQWIISALISVLSAVIAAVSYHDLRVAKEGADTSQIAAVFD
jgi:hypothetical protein